MSGPARQPPELGRGGKPARLLAALLAPRNLLWPVLLGFDTAGQLCLKQGSSAAGEQLSGTFLSQILQQVAHAAACPWIWAGVGCLFASFLTWLLLLRWNPLSRAFTIASLSYVTVFAASWALLHEPVHLLQAVGVASVIAGVILIGAEEAPGA